jgi:putative ABC transport system substrate-binding protein
LLYSAAPAIWPLPARAQQNRTGARIPKVGVLWHAANADEEKEYLAVLTGAFRDLGYAEGQNVEFLHRYPAEQPDRFRVLARDLVESNVDVVVAVTGRGAMTVVCAGVIAALPIVPGAASALSRSGSLP